MNWEYLTKRIRLSDIILLILVVMAVGYTSLHYASFPDNIQVYIYVDNQLWGVYPFTEEKSIVINEHNSIEIKDGQVRMSYSDCPDKRCMKQGFSSSMPIICLPNKVMIEVKASDAETRLILQ